MAATIVLSIGCCGPGLRAATPRSGEARTPAEQASAAATVTTICVLPDGRMGMGAGSAVLVSDRVALTAAHVIDCPAESQRTVVLEFPGNARKVEVTVVDFEGDIARLTLAEPIAGPDAQVGPMPEIDDRICLVTAVPTRERRCGDVQSYSTPPGNVRHGAITSPGNSGSGVYDARGRLVGIVTHFVTCSNGQFCGGAFTSLEGRPWSWVQR
jgi:S1-C subfamily serine protease